MISGGMKEKILAWVKISRLQFYPMTWVAYTLGAVASSSTSQKFDLRVYGLGYLFLFLVELFTILTNEYYDYATDSRNKNAGPFTGGTRILVEGKLGFHEVRIGILTVLGVVIGLGYMLLRIDRDVSSSSILLLLLIGIFLGAGYTAPPLKLSYRGWGELTVGLTHSPYVIECGYIFQGGSWRSPLPWLICIPLFFATLAAITLAGIPDRLADREVSKRVWAVIWGARGAAILASFFVCIAAASGALLWYLGIIDGTPGVMILIAVPHGLVLLFALSKLIQTGNYDRKIDGIMVLALSYIIWFGVIPLAAFVPGLRLQ
jgi:1,4-dihydroxy-2-naphthoate octaprenyltransferase